MHVAQFLDLLLLREHHEVVEAPLPNVSLLHGAGQRSGQLSGTNSPRALLGRSTAPGSDYQGPAAKAVQNRRLWRHR